MDNRARNMKFGGIGSQAMAKKSVNNQLKLGDEEKEVVDELKKLYLETIKLDVDMQREIYLMEKMYEEKHNKVYDQRLKILQDFKKSYGDVSNQCAIQGFWLKVLKSSYTEFITKSDEKALLHLVDVRSRMYNDPTVKFVLEFYFEPNEFISNAVLTKSYYLNCIPDVDDPLTYDGAEIFRCEGCTIDWKSEEIKTDKKAFNSFFDFFDPPVLPLDVDDPTYSDINSILQNDFELGFYLKERVIPKAVMFFTGEIVDCQESDSESESEEEDTEEADEDSDAAEEELAGE